MLIFGKIEKTETLDDGSLIVHGVASSEAVDGSGEVITAEAMKAALPEYLKWGNVREMHQPSAVGKTIFANVNDDGKTEVSVRVVDSEAIKKVNTGVYQGFSIGGGKPQRDPKDEKRIVGLKLSEISLVDRPMNPECVFKVWTPELGKDIEKKAKEHDEGEHEYDHEDHYSKYGDVEYADPYNHKYPIDTEKHIRAALSYFAMPRNHNKYSPGEQARIHGRIAAAAHRHGITLSADETKKMEQFMTEELTKKIDALTTTVTGLADTVAKMQTAAGESVRKADFDAVVQKMNTTQAAAEAQARADVISKMHSEGRYPINPDTNVAYKDEELQKMDMPTLRLLKANSLVLPMTELAKVNGEVQHEELKSPDGKPLAGMARAEAAFEKQYSSVAQFNRMARNGQ